jgi:hypothetical protein
MLKWFEGFPLPLSFVNKADSPSTSKALWDSPFSPSFPTSTCPSKYTTISANSRNTPPANTLKLKKMMV